MLALQGLADPTRGRLDGGGLVELIARLGFVQLDSVYTVERAHHMILFTRAQGYRPPLLRRPLETERRLFEHWTDRIAAVIPTDYYPYWNRRFRREQARLDQKFARWFGGGFKAELDRIEGHVREHGPVMARDFADGAGGSQGWWDWNASKTALEYLWRTGRLAVTRREGFQKVYDLPERVIPDPVRTVEPEHDAFVDWACRSALERLGIATSGEIARFWGLVTPDEAKAWCREHAGDVLPVAVADAGGGRPRAMIARPDLEDLLTDLPEPPPRVRALNPFDPLLRDRQRVERLFGFDYRIEIFVPAARRTYGYYVFPLLEGDRLIGRLDMKAARDAAALDVTALWLEPGVNLTRGRQHRLEAELDRIRRFIGVDAVRFGDGYGRTR